MEREAVHSGGESVAPMSPHRDAALGDRIMARYFGTGFDDAVTGLDREANDFFDFGIGTDKLAGGTLNDTFYLSVDDRADYIDGGAGEDRVDYSQSDRGLMIDLGVGKVDAVFNGHTGLAAKLVSIEDVRGSNFADTIVGSSGKNVIDGGGGNDTVSYSHSNAPVHVDLNQLVQHGGDAEGDQLTAIENVTGSSYDDTLTGKFDGQVGLLNGGPGSDTVDYSSASRGMTIVLDHDGVDGSATLNATDITGVFTINGMSYAVTSHFDAVQEDSLRGIDNVIGTAAADTITGNDANNRLEGGVGNDVIYGGNGSDIIVGGPGSDQLWGAGPGYTNDNAVDTFIFSDFHDSNLQSTIVNHVQVLDNYDTIMDFVPGQDKIDFSGMNAQVWYGAALHWIDDNSTFTGHPGEVLIYDPTLNGGHDVHGGTNEGQVTVSVDLDGDRLTDFALTVASPFTLNNAGHGDFIL
jgi:Ca2+-binding RTX toxin-like protein